MYPGVVVHVLVAAPPPPPALTSAPNDDAVPAAPLPPYNFGVSYGCSPDAPPPPPHTSVTTYARLAGAV
jgi:hypothetical protein